MNDMYFMSLVFQIGGSGLFAAAVGGWVYGMARLFRRLGRR